MAKDAVFPSRALQRQLVSAQQRLRDMQDELETMREQEARERRRRKRKRHLVSVTLTFVREIMQHNFLRECVYV